VYDYTPNRSRDGPEAFLKAFQGYLQRTRTPGTIISTRSLSAGSWRWRAGRTRGDVYEAQSSDLMRSTVMLAYIRLLYDVEREAREQN